MLKLFFSEIRKITNSYVWLNGLLMIIMVTVVVSILEFRIMPFGATDTFFVEYMLYNLTFIPIKIMLPCMLALMTASIFASEYSSGLIKSFLICGVKRKNLYFGKILFLVMLSLLTALIIFFTLSTICIGVKGIDCFTKDSYLQIMGLYVLAGIGVLPVILLTILFSQLCNEFEKSVMCTLVVLVLSLACDGIKVNPFYTPTGFLSHSNLLYYNDISTYWYAFVILIGYLIIINLCNLFLFIKKDVWS